MLKNCRICNKPFLSFLSLGNQPCADTFLKSKKKSLNLKKFPLVVGYCDCSHLSSIYPISGFLRYEKHDYSYTSDNSIVSRIHFKPKIKKHLTELGLKAMIAGSIVSLMSATMAGIILG